VISLVWRWSSCLSGETSMVLQQCSRPTQQEEVHCSEQIVWPWSQFKFADYVLLLYRANSGSLVVDCAVLLDCLYIKACIYYSNHWGAQRDRIVRHTFGWQQLVDCFISCACIEFYTTNLSHRYHGSTLVSASLTGYVFLLMAGLNE